jgi:hypothetical protein
VLQAHRGELRAQARNRASGQRSRRSKTLTPKL